jgi:hypothetical protein
MDTIDRDTILTLAARADWPSVSILMPTDPVGIHTDADRIRFRNLVRDAHDLLVGDGVRGPDADELLSEAIDLADHGPLLAGGPSGLALFAAGDTRVFWLDQPLPETVIVGDRFYLRPLYGALADDTRAWALAIDSNHTRLFRLDRSAIEEVALPEGTPLSMADDMRFDLHEESLQYHTVPGATPQGVSPGSNAAMYHGHGGSKDVDKMQHERFMQELSRGVVETIGAQSADPLVLLGVDYLVEDFRTLGTYAHVASEQVIGATDYLSPADVQRKVLTALAPRVEAAAHADVEEYRALAGTGRSSSSVEEILVAAATGRVKTLLMDESQGPWGYFDRDALSVTRVCRAKPRWLRDTTPVADTTDVLECGWDLVDLAAAETLLHGGTVRAFDGEGSPVSGAVAVFRY